MARVVGMDRAVGAPEPARHGGPDFGEEPGPLPALKCLLAHAGNHCQGTLFRDGAAMITPQLERAIAEALRLIEERPFLEPKPGERPQRGRT